MRGACSRKSRRWGCLARPAAVKARERAHALVVALGLGLALAAPASAQPDGDEPEVVTIGMAACDPAAAAARARLAHQVEVELRVAGISVVDPVSAPDGATHVTIVPAGCHPSRGAAIVVRAPGRPPLRRAIEAAGDGADRVLALALVDALRQAWARPREDRDRAVTIEQLEALRADEERQRAELLQTIERRSAAMVAARDAETAERAQEAIARRALPEWDLYGGGALLGYLEGGAALLGIGLGGGLTLEGPLRLALDVMGGYGVVGDPLGEVGLSALRGLLALELHARAAPLTGFAGVWIGAGYSRAEGRPADGAMGAVLEAASGALGLRAGAAAELSDTFSFFARVDAGYELGGVAANAASSRRVAATRGVVVGLTIGARFAP